MLQKNLRNFLPLSNLPTVRTTAFKPTERILSSDPAADPAYWEARLLRERFTAEARPGSENEFFARFEYEGHWVYFPLESTLSGQAAARAYEIHRLLTSNGWKAVCRRYVRQMIWAIFWSSEPLTCTYATLFTATGRNGAVADLPARDAKRIPVALVEANAEVRRGLEQNLNQTKGYVCVQTAALVTDLLQQPISSLNPPRLVLFNQRSLDLAGDAFQEKLHSRWPGALALPFGIYGHSDELFITIHGMDKGYFLRRRTPNQILEPLEGFWQGNSATPPQLRAQVQAYFQKLILYGSPDASSSGSGVLTQREAEILRYLGAGHTDKTISSMLGISAWTVHAHVKSIFEKLGVHTRAEAIMRYMQK
jgi:DNA-binding NarL/FixJ family response regulator